MHAEDRKAIESVDPSVIVAKSNQAKGKSH
jgi:hypothetical protein